MAFFEKQNEPVRSAGTCLKCSKPTASCVCKDGKDSAFQDTPADTNSPLSETRTTFSEISGRSLLGQDSEAVLTFSQDVRRPREPAKPPERISDRYQVEELIGVGGMGAVYKGRHEAMGKTLAIKVLHEDAVANKKAVLRFDQEARAASALTHPHLVSVYDYGVTDEGAPYLVMDYLEGKSLGAIIKEEGALPPARALSIFIQIAEGIQHAHKKGVIHRDLKPSNVIITKSDREEDFVKIVDFGIAKLMPAALGSEENGLTQTGEIFGSPLYMSPEQCTGQNLDQRSDIYSLGCLMYETLTGRPPLQGANPVQTIMLHVQEEAPPMTTANNITLPVGLESVVMRCLSKAPAERYQSAEALLLDLEKIRDGGKPTNSGSIRRFGRALMPRDRQGMLLRALVFGLLLSLPLAASFYFVDRLFPDQVKIIAEKGDQAMKDPVDPITAEACYKRAIALGWERKIDAERQAVLYDKLAYCYLHQAQAKQNQGQSDFARRLISELLHKALEQYKNARAAAIAAHNNYLAAKAEYGAGECLREDSEFQQAQSYYDDCITHAKKAAGKGEEVLGPALINRARNLHDLKLYLASIAAANEAAMFYNKPAAADKKPETADQRYRAAAVEIAADGAAAGALDLNNAGNKAGATKLYEEADQYYDEAANILRSSGLDNESSPVKSIRLLQAQTMKKHWQLLKEEGDWKGAGAIEKRLNELTEPAKERGK